MKEKLTWTFGCKDLITQVMFHWEKAVLFSLVDQHFYPTYNYGLNSNETDG